MACGTACISTEVGDINKIISNKKFLVKRENPQLLFEAIKSYSQLENKEKEKISFELIDQIKKQYSLKKMNLAYLNAYPRSF